LADKKKPETTEESLQLKYKRTVKNKALDILIGIAHDGLSAYLTLEPSKTRSYQLDEIQFLLNREGIVYGLDNDAIAATMQTANDTKIPQRDKKIAQGTAPDPGKDAEIKCHFKTDFSIDLKEDEDGNIDYKELNRINNVEKDQLLAEKIPMVDPSNGTDIYGQILTPKPPRDHNIAPGKGVRVDDEGTKAYADIDGMVYTKGRTISVSPIYMVPQDVDMTTGNVSFNGSVIVQGNVLTGFTIKAKQDITVFGVVEAATLIAGGNIFIKKGFKGGDKGLLQAKGDITAKFFDAGNCECHGNITIESSIINANVTCHGKINVTRKKGIIVGGVVRSIGGIECNEIGSKLGVSTRIVIGDKFLIKDRMAEVDKQIEAEKQTIEKITMSLDGLGPMLSRLNELPAAKRQTIEEIMDRRKQCKKNIDEFENMKDKLQSLFQMKTMSTVKAKKVIYPNSHINIGLASINLATEQKHCTASEDHVDGVIKFGPW
jgi:uncharacterized protein (DUF342 family)